MENRRNRRLGLWAGLAVLVLMLGVGAMATASFAATPSGATVPNQAKDKPVAPIGGCTPVPDRDYTVTSSAGATVIPGTADIGNHTDDGTTNVVLPFPVSFYGSNFNSALVGSNGTIGFTTNGNAFTNTCLPYASANNFIAPYWDDQLTIAAGNGCPGGGCGIFSGIVGTSPSRTFILEWRSCVYVSTTTCGQQLNYEVLLHEDSSNIEFVYANIVTSGTTAYTVGIQQATGAPPNKITQWTCPPTANLTNGQRLAFAQIPCGQPTFTPQPPTNTNTVTPTRTPTLFTLTPTATFTPTQTPTATPCVRYSFATATATMIVAANLVPGSQTDDATVLLSPPFPITFHGVPFSGSVRASTNGNVQFNSSSTSLTNACLTTSSFSYAAMPYWDDLLLNQNPAHGIYTDVVGTAPNRIFVVEWRACLYSGGVCAAGGDVNFEALFNETSTNLSFIYALTNNGGLSATVGTQQGIGPEFTQVSCNTASLTNGERINFTAGACGPTFTPTNTPTITNTPTMTNTLGPTKTPASCLEGSNYVIVPGTDTLVAGVTDTGNHCDDCTTAIPLPFTYVFYGNLFTTANVGSNGNIQFNSANATQTNTCLPAASFGATIFAYWDDLRTDQVGTGCTAYGGTGCGIYTTVQGAFPNRVFIIEWRTAYFDDDTTRANFEIKLYENAGPNGSEFDIIYGELAENGVSATVGVQKDPTGALVSQYSCNTAVLTTGRKLHFRPIGCAEVTQTPTAAPPTATNTNTPPPTNTSTPTSPPVSFTPSQTPCSTSTPLVEGFESGTLGAFTTTVITATNTWAAVTTPAPNTGTFSAFVADISTPSDSRMTLNSPIAIPLNATHATLSFFHKYSFENSTSCFDAGVLETSTNGGATWNDAGGLIISGGYTGVVSTGFHSPLAGRPAWCNALASYGQVQVNLLPLAGNNVLFRFRQGTDDSLGATGWNVDDVTVKIGTPCSGNLVGHVIWQSIPQNNPRSALPITLTLKLGTNEVNYPQQNTDNFGYFTVSVGSLAPGTYNWRVQGPNGVNGGETIPGFLANCGTINLAGAPTTQMENSTIFSGIPACAAAPGCIRGADADNNNIVAISDFNALKAQFNQVGSTADFDKSGIVSVTDFNILKSVFNQGGCSAILSPGEMPGKLPSGSTK